MYELWYFSWKCTASRISAAVQCTPVGTMTSLSSSSSVRTTAPMMMPVKRLTGLSTPELPASDRPTRKELRERKQEAARKAAEKQARDRMDKDSKNSD